MKDETKHTPGPWHANPLHQTDHGGESRAFIGIGGNGSHIGYASVTGCVRLEEAQANAELIASAPDLLKQRDELLRILGEIADAVAHIGNNITPAMIERVARQAIASVKGEK